MNGSLFPTWQVSREEYERVCAHLRMEPQPGLYDRLLAHLAEAPFRNPQPGRFARALARQPLSRWRIARLDLASRLFLPAHPIRHVLNTVIALHECSAEGYRQLSRARRGMGVWLDVAGAGLSFAVNLLLTLPWIGLQAALWTLRRPFVREPELAGRCVLITGVARGLGADLMFECLERGARVIGTVRNDASRQAILRTLPAAAPAALVVADLSRPGEAVAALSRAGIAPANLHAVVLCAGTKHDGHSVLDLTRLRDTLQVNLLSCAELAAWLFADGRPGPEALGVISSIGRWHGMHSTAGYNASKAALSIWAESLEMDLARRAMPPPTVTVIEPGLFQSGMNRSGGLRGRLSIPRRRLAGHIVDAVFNGKRSLREPRWFALLTWIACAAGRRTRARLFARAKA